MKNTIIVVGVLVMMIFACSPALPEDQHPTLQTTEPGPVLPPPPKPGEMIQRLKEMIAQHHGQNSETMRQCRIVMRSAIYLDSPSAILGQKESLGLTDDQAQKLNDIENEARRKAKTVLTKEQIKKLGIVPDKAVAVTGACLGGVMSNVEQMLQNLISGQGAGSPSQPKAQ
jgi:hypothetical protein